jgi:hypothetical protein
VAGQFGEGGLSEQVHAKCLGQPLLHPRGLARATGPEQEEAGPSRCRDRSVRRCGRERVDLRRRLSLNDAFISCVQTGQWVRMR